ncbi:TRAP transporter large permease [Nitratireductor sp.]|uniref:TRAP transporter large permease n=1 Tax=Nitratireductor sp. TaxID=1872084 RepID=UPI0025DBB5C7|nr:TRAP transporter large permease subunit [Nitratireductor sp.]
MSQEIFLTIYFVASCLVLLTGFPVAFTLGGIALIFAGIGASIGLFNLSFLGYFPERLYGIITNDVLVAIPIFVAMGVILERSKVAEELLYSMARLFGRLPGGLGISVTIVGALLAASTGIVGATVVAMGLVSLPLMLRHRYSPRLASGSIAAAGTLGQIIPPSTVLILLGDALSPAYQQAQLKQGNFAPEPLSVGDLFAGALFPGLALAGLYIMWQIAVAIFAPQLCPPVREESVPAEKHPLREALRALVAPLVLIIAVLGSIIAGIATPTEAASVGAVGAIFLAGLRGGQTGNSLIVLAIVALVVALGLQAFFDLRVARSQIPLGDVVAIFLAAVSVVLVLTGLGVSFLKLHKAGVMASAFQSTVKITVMIFSIMIGAALFSLVFRGMGGDDIIHEALSGLPGGLTTAIVVVLGVMFLLGFFIDIVEIIYIVVPLVAPVLFVLGADPVWLGVMMGIVLQTSFLTPPFGYALFYLKGVAPASIRTTDIYRGVIPFVGVQILALILIWFLPQIALWLPAAMGR